jgi:hypothetical protein
MTWHRYQVGENKIMFYDKDGHRPFRVAPFDAWDYNAEELDELAKVRRGWQRYLSDPVGTA